MESDGIRQLLYILSWLSAFRGAVGLIHLVLIVVVLLLWRGDPRRALVLEA